MEKGSKEELTKKLLKLNINQASIKNNLKTEKLKSEAYSIMIEIAEKEFKIPIRKKLDVKQ